MQRSFSPPDPHREPAFVSRPPVGEEGAAYARVRRYLWADAPASEPPAAGDRAPEPLPPTSPRP